MQSIVTDRVAWSVSRSVTLVSPAKIAELIEMPLGLWTRVGPGNHVLDGGSRSPMGRVNFEGERSVPLLSIGHSVVTCVKTATLIVMPFGLWAQYGPRSCMLDGVQIPHEKGQFWWKVSPIVKYSDFLP